MAITPEVGGCCCCGDGGPFRGIAVVALALAVFAATLALTIGVVLLAAWPRPAHADHRPVYAPGPVTSTTMGPSATVPTTTVPDLPPGTIPHTN